VQNYPHWAVTLLKNPTEKMILEGMRGKNEKEAF